MKIKRMPRFKDSFYILLYVICSKVKYFWNVANHGWQGYIIIRYWPKTMYPLISNILPLTISLLFEYLNFIIETLWIIAMQFSIYAPFYLYKLYISFFYQRKQMWLQSEWSLFNVVLCGTLSSNTTYFTSFFKEVTIYRPLSRLSLWKKTKNKLLFWCVPMYVCKKTLAVEKDKRYKSSIGS